MTSLDHLQAALDHLDLAVSAATDELEAERQGRHGVIHSKRLDQANQLQSIALVARAGLSRDLSEIEKQRSSTYC